MWTRQSADDGGTNDAAAQLNPGHVFETFIQGANNRSAFAAAAAVAEKPGQVHNPLCIWGQADLGISHLLHAIGHETLRLYPQMQVRRVMACDLADELIAARREARARECYDRYLAVDVLLIEDLQSTGGHDGGWMEVSQLLGTLHLAGRQIVFTTNKHPRAIAGLSGQAHTLFKGGLVVGVRPPDLAHRVAILQAEAELQAIPVPNAVILFVSRRVRGSVQHLERTLGRIIAAARREGVPVTVDLAAAELVRREE